MVWTATACRNYFLSPLRITAKLLPYRCHCLSGDDILFFLPPHPSSSVFAGGFLPCFNLIYFASVSNPVHLLVTEISHFLHMSSYCTLSLCKTSHCNVSASSSYSLEYFTFWLIHWFCLTHLETVQWQCHATSTDKPQWMMAPFSANICIFKMTTFCFQQMSSIPKWNNNNSS